MRRSLAPKLPLLLAVATAAGLVGVVDAAAAEPPVEVSAPIASPARTTAVAAGHGVAVFSDYDEAAQRFVLRLLDASGIRTLPITGRRMPFDASVGTGAAGQPVVTYSACTTETRRSDPLTAFPYWPDRRGCAVRSFDVRSGADRVVRTQAARGGALWLPVQHAGELVYARLRDLGRREGPVHRYRFEVVRRDGRGRTSRLLGGPGATADVDRRGGGDLEGFGSGVTSLTFDGARVGFTWVNGDRRCPSIEDGPGQYATSVWLTSSGGARRRVARNCNSGPREFTRSASLTTAGMAWAESGRNADQISVAHVASVSRFRGPVSRRPFANRVTTGFGTTVPSVAVDGPVAWYVQGLDGRSSLVRSAWP